MFAEYGGLTFTFHPCCPSPFETLLEYHVVLAESFELRRSMTPGIFEYSDRSSHVILTDDQLALGVTLKLVGIGIGLPFIGSRLLYTQGLVSVGPE